MKITDATPPAKKVYQIEVNEHEAAYLRDLLGNSAGYQRNVNLMEMYNAFVNAGVESKYRLASVTTGETAAIYMVER